MHRRLLNAMTVFSLLLCVAVCVLWHSGDIYYFGHYPRRWSFTAEQGTITIYRGYEHQWETKVHWVLLFTLALPASRALCARSGQLARYWARQRSDRMGLCRSCGYDLRATPDKCPECGTVATPSS